jgi:hypothetical protein
MRLIRVTTLGTLAAALMALCAPAASAGAHAARHCGLFCPHDWENSVSSLAWQDPGSGGSGTDVLAGTDSASAKFDWSVAQDPSRCGGIVTASCPGGSISAHDVGKSIVTIKHSGSSLCMGADASTSWNVTMQACDRKSAPNLATAFVYLPDRTCGQVSDTKFASLASNATPAGRGKITGDNMPGHDLAVTSSPATCVDQLWFFLAS